MINSHTRGEWLDDQKFWDIFAAAEALNVPIYIHPSGPPPSMVAAVPRARARGRGVRLRRGSGAARAAHHRRGAFDRFPKLKIVIGHTGEGLPFWLYASTTCTRASVKSERYATMKPLKRKPSDYMRENLYVTNSGVAWEPSIMFCHKVLGADHVLYAMDYPYQFVPEEVKIADALPMSDRGQEEVLPDERGEAVQALKAP